MTVVLIQYILIYLLQKYKKKLINLIVKIPNLRKSLCKVVIQFCLDKLVFIEQEHIENGKMK